MITLRLITLFLAIQTDAQAKEGLIIGIILLVFLGIVIIYSLINDAEQKKYLMNKLKEGKVTWDDYYKAVDDKYTYEASQIEKFLNKQSNEHLQSEAKKISRNFELENSDKNLTYILNMIENKTHKCNKCYSNYMRIWNLNSNLIELRCENCKKKFTYLDDSIPNINFDDLINKINLLYERKELGEKNKYLRELGFELDFEGQKANSPKTYPITLEPLLEPIKGKTKTKSITPEENDVRSRRISQDVKDKVWNRDSGKCVECGSNQNLEFDHIIPFSKGGANTYRNIQLMCESCNRSKSDSIG